MNMSAIRFLYSFAGLFFLSSIACFNSFYLAEAKSQTSKRPLVRSTELRAGGSVAKVQGQTGKRPLVRSTELRAGGSAAAVQGQTGKRPLVRSSELKEATAEQRNQNFTLQREKKELRARGVVVRFHRWPSTKQRKKVAGILRSQSLKRTRSIKDFKAQLFEWKEGGLKPSGQAERSCVRIRGLSYVRRCSPDHLLPVNASRTKQSRTVSPTNRKDLYISPIEQDKQNRTEADFVECKDCKNQGLKSIAEPLKEVVSVKSCGLIPSKQKLMDGKLSDYWAQELTGSDLLREELKKTDPPDIENWIAVFDTRDENHNIHVSNLISGEGAYAVLPELTDRKNPLIDNVDMRSESKPSYEKKYKAALTLYETSHPGDYLFGFRKRAPHYINNSMGWAGSEDISEVFEKLSSAKISPSVVVVSAGNSFPERLEYIQEQASRDFDVILVGSFSPKGFVSWFSQSGNEVSVLAPSDQWITSAGKQGEYEMFGGTSGAAPLVTGSLAGFEWLSGYHPTAQEAKILLEKTALPTVHSHEKPRINGAGLLNSYKLGEVAKRLKKKCSGRSASCFKEEIRKDENYQFSEDKDLKEELSKVFPSCGFGKENSEVLSKISNCEEKKEMFNRLRRSVLLSPRPELLRSLSCIYKGAGFSQNAKALESLRWALGSEKELRAKLKMRAGEERKIREIRDETLRLMLSMGGFEEELTLSELKRGLKMAEGLGEKALPLLERGFNSGNLELQKKALDSAERVGEKALPLLKRGYDGGNLELQKKALDSAGRVGEKALPLLKRGYDSGNLELQKQALYSAEWVGEKALPLLKRGYDSGNLELQKEALLSASGIGEEGLPLLERGLDSGDPSLQKEALESAGRVGEKALPLLKRGYDSGNLELQMGVLYSAGRVGEKALPLLKRGYDSGNLELQMGVLYSAGRVGEKALPLLKRGYDSGNLELQMGVLYSAGRVGEKALPLLERGYDSGNLELQKEALESAKWAGEKALPLLKRGYDSGNLELQKQALVSARGIGEKGLPLLERGFNSGNLELQKESLGSAGRVGVKALPLLYKMLKNPGVNQDIKNEIQSVINQYE